MRDTLIEIKNNLQGNNSRVDEAKIQINDLEHKEPKITQLESQEEKRLQQNEDSISSLWDIFKHSKNLHHKGARRRERARKLEIYVKK